MVHWRQTNLQALLSHRNTPDPESQVSPAQIVYGRAIRDHIPKMSYLPHAHWQELAAKREDCFLRRHYMKSEKLDAPAKALKELHEGDKSLTYRINPALHPNDGTSQGLSFSPYRLIAFSSK